MNEPAAVWPPALRIAHWLSAALVISLLLLGAAMVFAITDSARRFELTQIHKSLGIVALFRSPAAQRWKFAFNTEKNEKSGIVIGLHACAMTVTSGTLTTPAGATPLTDVNLLSPAVCGS